MNKKYFPLLFGLLPAAVILAFLFSKLYTAGTGQEILLKTAPVDPRDLFRGDYINLRYDISTVKLGEVLGDGSFTTNDAIYAALSKKDSFWQVDSVSRSKPKLSSNQVCMKGKVTSASNGVVLVEWGIGSYFVPEGKGRPIERERNLSVRISVDNLCRTIVKGLLVNDTEVTW